MPLSRSTSGARRAAPRRGLSLVELLVGVAIGLVIAAAASLVLATQLVDNRRLLLETQIQQDLRATADIITRELRRAGYWGNAFGALWYPGTAGPRANPYTAVSPVPVAPASAAVDTTAAIRYSREPQDADDDTIGANEERGFRLADGVVQMRMGTLPDGDPNYQPLTDPAVLVVEAFDVTTEVLASQPLVCANACVSGGPPCPPTVSVREMTVRILARATSDATVRREMVSKVRLRNDLVEGECPP